MRLLAIDPGKVKFGYAVLTGEKRRLAMGIADTKTLLQVIGKLISDWAVNEIVMGDGTGAKDFLEELHPLLETKGLKITLVDETDSSREGRRRFILAERKGWRRFFPIGLQTPWRAYDDYVAVILGERYLS